MKTTYEGYLIVVQKGNRLFMCFFVVDQLWSFG